MKFTSVTKLKDWIRNKAKEIDAPIDITMRSFMMERFLERISLSEYRDNFIIKGGFLIKALVGIDLRMTMDMDATIKGIQINYEAVEKIINEISLTDADHVIIDLPQNTGAILKNVSTITTSSFI